jgi:hypothetical protein
MIWRANPLPRDRGIQPGAQAPTDPLLLDWQQRFDGRVGEARGGTMLSALNLTPIDVELTLFAFEPHLDPSHRV